MRQQFAEIAFEADAPAYAGRSGAKLGMGLVPQVPDLGPIQRRAADVPAGGRCVL